MNTLFEVSGAMASLVPPVFVNLLLQTGVSEDRERTAIWKSVSNIKCFFMYLTNSETKNISFDTADGVITSQQVQKVYLLTNEVIHIPSVGFVGDYILYQNIFYQIYQLNWNCATGYYIAHIIKTQAPDLDIKDE